MNQNYEKYLPIGTVVRLKSGTKRVMITGFCVAEESDENVIFDYSGCIYPEGFLSNKQTCLFNHEQIEQIYFLGFVDEEEKEFKQKLNEFLKNINIMENNYVPQNSELETNTKPVEQEGTLQEDISNSNNKNTTTVEQTQGINNSTSNDTNQPSEVVIPNDEGNLESDSTGFPTFNTVQQEVPQTNVFIPNIINDETESI